MRYLLLLLVSIAIVNGLQYQSQEYRVTFNACPDVDVYLQEDNCVFVDIPGCVNDKYITIANNGSLYLKTFTEANCANEKSVESNLLFNCNNGDVDGASIRCQDSNTGVFYTISSNACASISGELNKCISFGNGQEQCGYKSARFSGNGNTPTFYGYSNSYCGNNEDDDVISSFPVSCIKSDESKVFDLSCGDTSSASTLIYTSSLLLFVILFSLL